MKIKLLLLFLSVPICASADDTASCLKTAKTQLDMNRCTGLDYQAADNELNRAYKQILKVYSGEKKFLNKLKESQRAWIKLRDADLEMMYPEENKRVQYGSAYPMCVIGLNTKITLQRIEYLKGWLAGIEEGDVCAGSIKRPDDIKEALGQ